MSRNYDYFKFHLWNLKYIKRIFLWSGKELNNIIEGVHDLRGNSWSGRKIFGEVYGVRRDGKYSCLRK